MGNISNCQKALFELVKAGMWEESQKFRVDGLEFRDSVDWEVVYQLASEQSVLGLVLAGINYLPNEQRPPQELLLQCIGEIQMLEQQNKEMNDFIGRLIGGMREVGIYTVLVKGQGVARCYERPLWRYCGDVDLLLDLDNYEKAKAYLAPKAESVDEEDTIVKHLGMTIDSWVVELHGTLQGGISKNINKVIDEVQKDTFANGHVRNWDNNGTSVLLPCPDNDVVFIFEHFVDHFFRGGLGLRQVCDWCRLLWTYKDSLNHELLESRIKEMGLMTEWKAFGAFAVEYLGIPKEAMPLYEAGNRWKRKARKMNAYILEVGNFGHNRDNSFYKKYPYLVYKIISLSRHIGDFFRHLMIFPKNSINVFCRTLFGGLLLMTKGK